MDKPDIEEQGKSALSRRRFFNSVAVGAAETALLTIPGQVNAQEIVEGDLVKVVLNVNGETHTVMVEPRWTLLHVLRDRLGLTGTKPGCERGECGACTVLIDGVARYSCLTLALESAGKQVTTIEGLMRGAELGSVQQAFRDEDGYQCGYCTPGQMMNVEGFLRKTPDPTIEQIREGVSGNLCRCGAYANIFKATQRAAEFKKAGR
jgi:xanthine dehydrogenase YagT iron-sulfur-binding subunit